MSALRRAAKTRAKRKGQTINISVEWLMEKVISQDYLCIKTAIPLVINPVSSPWSPSIDRIDSSLGYTEDNVQIVCYMYNTAKNNANSIHVQQFSAALIKNTQSV
jgi:hypothetical protein